MKLYKERFNPDRNALNSSVPPGLYCLYAYNNSSSKIYRWRFIIWMIFYL